MENGEAVGYTVGGEPVATVEKPMTSPCGRVLARLLFLAIAAVPGAAGAGGWQPAEKSEFYSVQGASGIELYRSIGESGPRIGMGRAIAYTDFKLLWSRDYQPQPDGSCTLVTARPSLTITYRLPEAKGDMPVHVRKAWNRFIEGIAAHEKVHGELIVEMVRKIEQTSVGLNAPADPGCRKVRAELQKRLGALSDEQREKSRSFDRKEMRDGGNVHLLILELVNGG